MWENASYVVSLWLLMLSGDRLCEKMRLMWSLCDCWCCLEIDYRNISNTIRTLVQYAPQTFTVEPWENVSLAVQYAPVLCHSIQTCSLPYIVLLSEVSYYIVHFFSYKLTKMYRIIYISLLLNHQCLLCL